MKSNLKRALALAAGVALSCAPSAQHAPSPATSPLVESANRFLESLDAQQRARVLYAFDDEQQRARWSNFPTAVVPRGGLALKDLNEAQRSAAMALVAAALSPQGFEKVQQIMAGDEVLKVTEADRPPPGPGSGPPPGAPPEGKPPFPGGKPPFDGRNLFGQDLYYVSLLGKPSASQPWALQFGGHHLALNLTMTGAQGVLTPSLTAAQPAAYESQGKTIRPLGRENDKAFALLNSLDQDQRQKAVLNYRVPDLVLGPGHDGQTIQPEGLQASAMTESQRALLLDLIAEWATIVSDTFSAARMASLRADLDRTFFAWSGPTSVSPGKNGSSYYRIQGPKLVIEYAPQGQRDDPSTHVHTMYRDPTNDYGRLATHR